MKSTVANAQPIPVERIFLDLANPRHKPYETQAEVIEYLCRAEYVYELAKDIAKVGLNPLELFAVLPLASSGRRPPASYVVAEGNRRMCALKLLHDPELAPASLRKAFVKLAEKAPQFDEVLGVAFDTQAQVNIWLERIHNGPQGGIGRKTWNPEQKTRHFGDKKNVVAQSVLDYAEGKGFISADARKGKLTTAQRYLSNPLVRESLGVDSSNIEDISRTRPEGDFDILVEKFVRDLVRGKKVHSRSLQKDIEKYSRDLGATAGISGSRNAPEPLSATTGRGKRKRKVPRKPKRPEHIAYEEEISLRVKNIPSYKLERIYYSICEIGLEDHTPLISVGVWSFFECLTARCGRGATTSFLDFLSKDKLNRLGFSERDSVNSIRQALQRISMYGNTTKHHEKSANFNGEQLANDMDALKDVIQKLAEEAKAVGI
jgi:hypothetical protein